jgi:hypothetical protein
LCFVVLLLAGCGAKNEQPYALPARLVVTAPLVSGVGQAIPVTVSSVSIPDGSTVTLLVLNSFGPRTYSAKASTQSARFIIPGEDVTLAGALTLTASYNQASGTVTVQIRSGPIVGPLAIQVGPRTISADGTEQGMVVALLEDRYGNLPSDGVPVELNVDPPDGRIQRTRVESHDGIAWSRLESGPRTGRMVVVGTTEDARGLEADLNVTAGWPVTCTLSADPAMLPADGRRLMLLRTSPIQDQHGNLLPDGTMLTFLVTMPDGRRERIPAYTVDGIAEAPLQAAHAPGIAVVVATLRGMISMPLEVEFTAGPAVGKIAVTVQIDTSVGQIRFTTSQLIGALGQLTPDGTPVTFRVTDAAGFTREVVGVTDHGVATAGLPISGLTPGAGSVRVGVGSGQGETTFVLR